MEARTKLGIVNMLKLILTVIEAEPVEEEEEDEEEEEGEQ